MFVFELSLQQWSYIAEIVTGAAIVFVFEQVRQAKRAGEVELITGMTTLILEVDRVFVEHPEMRKYFHDDTARPRDDELEQARAIAMTMANVLDHVVGHRRFMKCRTWQAWRRYITEVYAKSHVFKELLDTHTHWWPDLQEQVGGQTA